MQKEGIDTSKPNIERMIYTLANSKEPIYLSTRYIIASAMSTYMYKELKNKKGKIDIFKRYCTAMKNNNLEGALKTIGLGMNNQTLDILINTQNEYLSNIQKEIDKQQRTKKLER